MNEQKLSYKTAIQELEEIALKVENESPDIDELSDLIKRAAELMKFCQVRLKETEQEINDALGKMDD